MGNLIPNLLAWGLGLAALYVVAWFLATPIKWLLRLLASGVLGGLLLLAVNFAGGAFGIGLGVNPITCLVAGLLGVPGVALMLVVQAVI